MAGWRASRRSCSSGSMTSYGGATTSAEVGDRSTGRSEGHGTDGSRARDLTKRRVARRLSGPRPSYDSRRSDADGPCNFRRRAGRPCSDHDRSDAHVGCPCSVTRSRHASSPGARRGARIVAAHRRSSLGALGPARRCQSRPPTGRRWRPASCSAVTPGSGRGSRSRSTSRTTARRSPASSASRAARRARRASGRPSTCRPRPTRPTSSTPSRRRSAPSSQVDARRRRHDDRVDQGDVHRSTTRPSSSSPSSPSIPSGSSAASICRRTRTRSHRLVVTLTPDDLPERRRGVDVDRPDRLAGRRRRPAVDRRSSTRCAAGSPAADDWSSPAGRPGPRRSSAFPDALLPYRPVVTTDVPAAEPDRHPRPAARPARRTLPALSGDAHRGPDARHGRRPGRRRRTAVRLGLGHAARVRPDASTGSPRPTPSQRPLAPPAAAADVRWPDVHRRQPAGRARSRSCRRWRCRRSAA